MEEEEESIKITGAITHISVLISSQFALLGRKM